MNRRRLRILANFLSIGHLACSVKFLAAASLLLLLSSCDLLPVAKANPEPEFGRVQSALGSDGMVLLLVERPDELVTLNLLIRSGSANDPPDREGLAYVSARALLWGGGDWRVFDDQLADLGARLELQVEPSTILLRVELLAESAPEVFALLAELFAKPPSEQEVFSKLIEETLIRQSALREDDHELALSFFRRFVHEGSPLSSRMLGTRESMENLSLRDVQRFWAQHFVPSNMILAAAGELSLERLQLLAQQTWPASGVEAAALPEPRLTPRLGRRVLLVDKPMRSQNELVLGHLAPAPNDPAWPAFEVAVALVGGNFSSRLVRALRTQRGLTYDVRASRWRDAMSTTFYISTFAAPDRAMQVLEIILENLDRLVADGGSEEELVLARDYVAGHMLLAFDSPHTLALESARLLRYGLPPDAVASLSKAVAQLSISEIRAATMSLIQSRDLCIVMVCSAEHYGEALLRIDGVPSVMIARYDEE
ncbi:MAG: pitrilysin family protein [Myxococcota bacterium]|jgi:zinc protease|nr:pitrilysin family protein [Myxococcota bacterium]